MDITVLDVDNPGINVNSKITFTYKNGSMTNVGYSGTPLLKKLGIKDEHCILLLNFPGGVSAYWKLIEKDCSVQLCSTKQTPSFIHLFVTSQKEFLTSFLKIEKRLAGNIIFWVSWYKKSAGIKTDVTEDWIRNFALANNLVDVKVCAVTNEWSGLKLVIPVAKR